MVPKSSLFIRIVAGAYVIYLGERLIHSSLADRPENYILYIAAGVIFALIGLYWLVGSGIKMVKKVKIPYEKGLLGHSDADVLLHAIMDALLGAAALGDIGKHFPDTDPAYKGASSIRLLEEVGRMIDEKLYVIGNIDATIIAQGPKMAPHIEQMRKNVAEALHIEVDQVNIKATTEEGLGFTGTGEGISSQAIASLDTIANYSYRVEPSEGGCAGCGGCMKVQES